MGDTLTMRHRKMVTSLKLKDLRNLLRVAEQEGRARTQRGRLSENMWVNITLIETRVGLPEMHAIDISWTNTVRNPHHEL